jgi:hypothetical protein
MRRYPAVRGTATEPLESTLSGPRRDARHICIVVGVRGRVPWGGVGAVGK